MTEPTDYALPLAPEHPPELAIAVNRLELDELPTGELSRVFVEVTGDGLATGVRVPVLVARGASPGPVFGITAAVHGNELNGIPVIHKLFAELDPATLRGTVVGVVAVNVPGLHANQREFTDGTDLNHIFPGSEHGSVSKVYANRILTRIVHPFDVLVDLHTASFGRINSLYVRADMTRPDTSRMAYLSAPEIIVHNPASDYTLRGSVMALGTPAITVEVGDPQRYQKRYIRQTIEGLQRMLAEWGLVASGADPTEAPEPVICERSGWLYTDRGGLLEVLPGVTDRVKKDQLIARLRNAFGDLIREYHAPHDGIVIGRSTNPVGQTGARILHLGVVGYPAGFVGGQAA